MIKIAVLGYGTVGSGVVEVLATNGESIKKRAGEYIEVKYILDLLDFPGDPMQDKIVHDYQTILDDKEISLVVETMGGTKPAYEFVKKALLAGKTVCTSNKELVASHGAELLEIAKNRNVNFLFEASVGGGIPIIRPLNQCLTADEIEEIKGILNGTSNYILTKMEMEGSDFSDVLKEAQELGYAEKDPTADIEGYDACRKIAILTSLAYGKQVNYEEIYTEGITKISAVDFKYAEELGMAIKILGMSKKIEGKTYAMVSPQLIDNTNPLYTVNGVFNSILVKGNMLGDVMFYGKGAGKLPTASAVVSDVVDAVKHSAVNILMTWNNETLHLEPIGELENRFFVRVATEEKDKVNEFFGEVEEVSIGINEEYAFVTKRIKEKIFNEKMLNFDTLLNRIRLEL